MTLILLPKVSQSGLVVRQQLQLRLPAAVAVIVVLAAPVAFNLRVASGPQSLGKGSTVVTVLAARLLFVCSSAISSALTLQNANKGEQKATAKTNSTTEEHQTWRKTEKSLKEVADTEQRLHTQTIAKTEKHYNAPGKKHIYRYIYKALNCELRAASC